MRSKHITIEEEQAEWVEENYLNLSRFVQGQLQQLIEGDGEDDDDGEPLNGDEVARANTDEDIQ